MFHHRRSRKLFAETVGWTTTWREGCSRKSAATRSVSYVNYVYGQRGFVIGADPYGGGLRRILGENFRISVVDTVEGIKDKNLVNSRRNRSQLKRRPSPVADVVRLGEQLPIRDQQNQALLE